METKEILMIALIGLLLLVTAVQAIQLVTLSNNPVVVTSGSTANSASSGIATGQQPSGGSLNNLPSMVGGC